MGYIGQDEDHLESPGTPFCDSLQTSNPMQSSGDGILGGTIAGLVSFVAAFGIVCSGPQPLATGFADPWFLPGTVLFLGAGGCWGFYLSVWVYLDVETILQSF
jgi:hypothetical protein